MRQFRLTYRVMWSFCSYYLMVLMYSEIRREVSNVPDKVVVGTHSNKLFWHLSLPPLALFILKNNY